MGKRTRSKMTAVLRPLLASLLAPVLYFVLFGIGLVEFNWGTLVIVAVIPSLAWLVDKLR